MRVITGKARGRKLREPAGMDIRPTTDQVKEAMFNICQFDLEGRRVLDLFGGTGQLGIEAASRGASEVTVVDQSREALALIRENVRRAGLPVQVRQSERVNSRSSSEWIKVIASRLTGWQCITTRFFGLTFSRAMWLIRCAGSSLVKRPPSA